MAQAMDHAEQQGVIQLEAFANERASITIVRLSNESPEDITLEAEQFLRKAVDLYEEWGALGGSSYLRQKHSL